MTVPFLRSAVCATLLAVAGTATAQDVKFEFHGFVGASVYNENAGLSGAGGQGAWYVTSEPTVDEEAFGGDVRQTRFNFSLTGPVLWEGVTARGFLELDFFGGGTAGGFGDISLAPRLRIAFAELKLAKTGTMIRAGQDHDLVLGILLPTTVGHVAFPLSYTAGTVGWRRPQLAAYQTFPVGDLKLEFAAAIGRSGWTASTTAEPQLSTLGVSSGLPSFEGRAKVSGKVFEAFVAGHWSQIDASGYGSEPVNDAELDTTVVTAGGKISLFNATLQGAAYTGKNLGPLAGNVIQWQTTAAILDPSGADVSEVGAWLQAGYNFNSNWSAWLFTGYANPDDQDLVDAGITGTNSARGRNQTTSALVRFQQKGYTAGVEYTMFSTRYLDTDAAAGAQSGNLEGAQFMLSGMYFF